MTRSAGKASGMVVGIHACVVSGRSVTVGQFRCETAIDQRLETLVDRGQ